MADRRLQVFHAVAKHLSFTKAAEALFMTQPAVTFQIKQLEEHFNTRLFERGHGQISLTEAGRVVFDYSERILGLSAELDARLKDMTGRVGGPLLIGASMTIAEYLLPRVLGEFSARFPGVLPRLVVANSEQVQNQVAEHSLDVGFIESDSQLPSLLTEVACEDELLVVCAPSHPLARLKSVAPAMLVQHAYISREPGSGTREVTDVYLRRVGLSPDSLQPAMELGSPEALKGLVATGRGFAIMSRATVVKDRSLGILVGIPLEPRLVRNLSVVYSRQKFYSKLVSQFVAFARERLGASHAETLGASL
ncbi:MAG TPA: LysR family transcriptional regulator [Burkholderiales bacterium]|jgi:DNA-binding transcriptional LysR family regulator|nr:LysR family transcriptional regulator [Burkholderiales bacterium]